MCGHSKHMIESYLQFFNRNHPMRVQILRVSNPFGPYQNPYGAQGVVSVAFACALDDRTFQLLGNGEAIRDYIYIDDLVEAILKAMNAPNSNTLNISSGEGRSVLQILNIVEAVSGRKLRCERIEQRKGDVSVNVLANQMAIDELGWRPEYPFRKAMQLTWDWIQSQMGTASRPHIPMASRKWARVDK